MIAFSRSLLPLSLVILSACGAAPSPGNAAGTAPAKSEAQSPSEEAEAATDPIQDAIANPSRSEEDRLRDADRNPGDVLRFFQIAPGMAVADLMTGKGYYAEILARVVGEGGRVYAQNTPFVVERFADAPLSERLARPGLENVVRVDRELTDLGLEPGSLDAALMVLFYHDTYWQGVDRSKMNAEIYAALKPGGTYGIIDHHAEEGSLDRDVKTLHRVDAEIVKKEILAAGFEWAGESEVLRHPEDPRTANVFDEPIRGKTDRFVYRFRKPE